MPLFLDVRKRYSLVGVGGLDPQGMKSYVSFSMTTSFVVIKKCSIAFNRFLEWYL